MSVTIPSLAPWHSCSDCSGGPQPGARALLAHYLESVPDGTSLGIYNCRQVRGASSLSIHACGRAVDCGIPTTAAGHRAMYAYLAALAPHAEGLGVQLVIFDRTIWSAKRAPEGEPYRGVHPHLDHAHVELTPKAGEALTLATLRARVGDFRREPEAPTPPTTPPARLSKEALVGQLSVVDLSARGVRVTTGPVGTLQSLMAARRFRAAGSFDRAGKPDGIGGPGTRDALGRFQRTRRTGRPSAPAVADYIAGAATWSEALGTVRVMRFDRGVVRGSVVGTVQALLAARGYPPANTFDRGIPDEVGGRHTRAALGAFQEATGTGAADGSADLIVGPATWGALVV